MARPAKKRIDDGPTLFWAGDDAGPAVGAYGPPIVRREPPRPEHRLCPACRARVYAWPESPATATLTDDPAGAVPHRCRDEPEAPEPFPHTGAALDPARLRGVVVELAAQVIRPTLDAMEQAVGYLTRSIQAGDLGGVCTARGILEVALREAGRELADPIQPEPDDAAASNDPAS